MGPIRKSAAVNRKKVSRVKESPIQRRTQSDHEEKGANHDSWMAELGLAAEAKGVLNGHLGSPDEEKFAIRVGLTVLARANPVVFAAAMGAALSTLYSYSDADRPNRPGQEKLHQAAHLFSRFADDMYHTAQYLRSVADRSTPTRSRRPSSPTTRPVEGSRKRPAKAKRQ